jgi:hypothetical protein
MKKRKDEEKKDRLVALPGHLFVLKFGWRPGAFERSAGSGQIESSVVFVP